MNATSQNLCEMGLGSLVSCKESKLGVERSTLGSLGLGSDTALTLLPPTYSAPHPLRLAALLLDPDVVLRSFTRIDKRSSEQRRQPSDFGSLLGL